MTGLPELREKVEAEVKCQDHLRNTLDSDPRRRAAIIFFEARNSFKYQVICHYLQQQRATSSPVYDLVPETGKAKTIANFKLSNKKSAVKTFNLQNISYFATEQGKLFCNALCNSWKVIYKVGRPKNYSDFPLQLLTSSGEDDVRGTEKNIFRH